MPRPAKIRVGNSQRVQQGDIFEDVDLPEFAPADDDYWQVSFTRFPQVLVLSQDCDLAQDYGTRWGRKATPNEDKWLLSALVAPLYNADHVFVGDHLKELGITSQKINKEKTPGKMLLTNQNPRYHYLELPEDIGLPPLVVDFKHYFTVNVAYLRSKKPDDWVCALAPVFREDVSQRFSAFLSRIGLP